MASRAAFDLLLARHQQDSLCGLSPIHIRTVSFGQLGMSTARIWPGSTRQHQRLDDQKVTMMISTSTRRGTGVGVAKEVWLFSLQQRSEKRRRNSKNSRPYDAWANQKFTSKNVVFL